MFRPLLLGFALTLVAHSALAQARLPENTVLLGYTMQSARAAAIDTPRITLGESTVRRKSPMLAAALSLVIPGLGEYYVGDSYWRGAIFTGLEVGLWAERYHWIARGDDSTTAFWSFSDKYWSQSRYVDYLDSMLVGHGYNRVDRNGGLSAINAAEDTLNNLSVFGTDPTVKNFTHHLPTPGTQQYYELISKYYQFTRGWDDAYDEDPHDSPHDMAAAEMRDRMNHQYEVADYFLYGVIINHVLSAIDASLVAHDHNAPLRLQGSLERSHYQDGSVGYVPTAHIEYRF